MKNLRLSKYSILEIYSDGCSWKLGTKNSLNVYDVMKKIGLTFSDTPAGRELRNKVYRVVNSSIPCFRDEGLLFGGLKLSKETAIRYLIAETPTEHRMLHYKTTDQLRNKRIKSRMEKELIQKKMLLLEDTDKEAAEYQKILSIR
ncbi:MAG: hypothetical protein EOM19_05310 [Candidatus Moranbacteria bacterium]|nr:hypothetical protein [Candidatus Moranbacteria bacterium]